jgi:hypothetical protein
MLIKRPNGRFLKRGINVENILKAPLSILRYLGAFFISHLKKKKPARSSEL